MNKYAGVIIDIALKKLDRPFTYLVPESMRKEIKTGQVVTVPFGRAGTVRRGYVIELSDSCSIPPDKIKEIAGIEDLSASPDLETGAFYVQLAAWMKQQYGSTFASALRTVLPASGKGKPLMKREVRLLLDEKSARGKLLFFTRKHQVARERLLRELMTTPVLPYTLVTAKLHISSQTIKAMERDGILSVAESRELRNPVRFEQSMIPSLKHSREQQAAIDGVLRDFHSGRNTVSLLHGITGSGKTEVYISIIRQICEEGRQAIMLIPEISLTYQTLLRFYMHFGDRVSVVSSALTPSEKADQFERAKRGELDVMIGPRSALFTPFSKLGMIVIDEEHENSYKNESMPKYHTRETAIQIAQMRNACVLLGSATPSMETYYRAMKGDYRLYRLTKRLTGGMLPYVEIRDMREELQAGNRSVLSERLRVLIGDRLARKEQTMLFLNRRGISGFVSCRSCGHVFKCPHCDVSLSLHRGGRLMCHYCGHEEPAPVICPECGSAYVSGMRAGTQQVEQLVSELFPKARILRMDADTTVRKGSYEKILASFANEEADILIGTQMIVKGHDFPGVTLMGILMADLSLNAADYRAAERTFQLITQAAGRAGRGNVPGTVIIQTYQPDHYSILRASEQDYEGFYKEEVSYREILHYPPAYHMLAIQFQSEEEDKAVQLAGEIRELLVRSYKDLMIIGPAAASYGRIKDIYRFVLYIKDARYDKLRQCKDRTQAYLNYLEDCRRQTCTQVLFDFDPVNPY